MIIFIPWHKLISKTQKNNAMLDLIEVRLSASQNSIDNMLLVFFS
tara:strand:- start:58 stop:192 length:135 start_codon:yes stop_codon:yes gene_type:complete